MSGFKINLKDCAAENKKEEKKGKNRRAIGLSGRKGNENAIFILRILSIEMQ